MEWAIIGMIAAAHLSLLSNQAHLASEKADGKYRWTNINLASMKDKQSLLIKESTVTQNDKTL